MARAVIARSAATKQSKIHLAFLWMFCLLPQNAFRCASDHWCRASRPLRPRHSQQIPHEISRTRVGPERSDRGLPCLHSPRQRGFEFEHPRLCRVMRSIASARASIAREHDEMMRAEADAQDRLDLTAHQAAQREFPEGAAVVPANPDDP